MSARTRKTLMVVNRTLWIVFLILAAVSFPVELPVDYLGILLLGVSAMAFGIVLNRAFAKDHDRARQPAAVEVDPPVAGRWSALNSPADKVPSHGTHGYGQSYAIDITAEPSSESSPGADGTVPGRPGFAWLWPLVRRPGAYPAFGAPLYAVADATVVHASGGQRDHLSRSSLPMVLYLLLIESAARDMAGPARVFGNRIVLDLGDGVYAAYAHVQRGSLAVREGERVRAGQLLARCGNSGNSTEPHVHFQLMDSPDLDAARGIPFRWRGVGVPANGGIFDAEEPAPQTAAD
ncbi:M23 family metallopeptidase [Streptomyces katsurahamanus]|uniref:M23 family metallopeptidase n=1 Tax=Streptomyces katsurahamanus TaxID=2577098 RepID=A0ABW9NYP6_9ACTN|nr:M23 family metallopeptidase [Streptomyces katsurahamanus]MQS38451.1 M23 family metallopeptidase [Streptomyces katsurahamanus]